MQISHIYNSRLSDNFTEHEVTASYRSPEVRLPADGDSRASSLSSMSNPSFSLDVQSLLNPQTSADSVSCPPGQNTAYSRAQNSDGLSHISPYPSGLASSNDGHRIQDLSYRQNRGIKPTTTSRAEISEQSQKQMIQLDTEQGPIQIPVDVHTASKVTGEKRKNQRGASQRYRQRQKENRQKKSREQSQHRKVASTDRSYKQGKRSFPRAGYEASNRITAAVIKAQAAYHTARICNNRAIPQEAEGNGRQST